MSWSGATGVTIRPFVMMCGQTCWRRLERWQQAGVFDQLRWILLVELNAACRLDWLRACVDGSRIRAKRAAPTPVRHRSTGGRRAANTTPTLGCGTAALLMCCPSIFHMLDAKTVAKVAIGAANRPVAKLRFALTSRSAAPLRIEVGGHTSQRPGWICTDVCWRARHYLDATRKWPVRTASASHVYADNMIEHIRLEPNRRMFREARRVLAPGGRIRLATPDVEHAVRLYAARDEETKQQMEHDRRKGYEIHHPVDLLRSMFQDCGHHVGYLWDFDTLAAELEAAGFARVRRCAVGQSEDPALRNLESRPEFALIVEADAAV